MEMNPDCLRATLMTIENYSGVSTTIDFSSTTISSFPLLKRFSLDEVLYHLKKANEAGFLINYQPYFESATVDDLHYNGHQFLANIRDNKVWAKVQGIASKVGSKSTEALIQISSNVVSDLIKSQFGLS